MSYNLYYGSVPAITRQNKFQTWGSENYNPTIGYIQTPKPRWSQEGFHYQDVGALERFGIDPLKPAGGGVVMQANSYGYPVDGYTTGFTVKLPPPVNFARASATPRSFNGAAVLQVGDGTDDALGVDGDDPVAWVNEWQYGSPEQQAEVELERRIREMRLQANRHRPARADQVAAAAALGRNGQFPPGPTTRNSSTQTGPHLNGPPF